MADAAGLSITAALLSAWQPDLVYPNSSGLRVSRSGSAAHRRPIAIALALVTRQLLAQRDRNDFRDRDSGPFGQLSGERFRPLVLVLTAILPFFCADTG